MAKTTNKTIDEYISTFPENVQRILQEIRRSIQEVVPDAEEVISYQIPAFRKYGMLVYFAGWKNHVSMYPVKPEMEEAIPELADYKTSGKGTVQFSLKKPVPVELVKKIVAYRLAENLAKQKSRTA